MFNRKLVGINLKTTIDTNHSKQTFGFLNWYWQDTLSKYQSLVGEVSCYISYIGDILHGLALEHLNLKRQKFPKPIRKPQRSGPPKVAAYMFKVSIMPNLGPI